MATVLRAGRLWDGSGAPTEVDVELRIDGGRVVARGRRGTVTEPGDEVVERPEATVTPGFLDVHTHFCYPLDGAFQTNAAQPNRLAMLWSGFQQAASWLAQGVTAARDVGTAFDLDLQLKELIAAGRRPGPRLAASGRMMTMTGGRRNAYDFMKEEVCGATEARAWTRRHLKNGPDVIKLYCTTLLEEDVADYLRRALATPEGARDPGRWASLTVDEIRAVTHEAHKLGRTVAAHTAPAFGIALALRGGVDTIEHGSDLDDACIDLFLETGATLVPTLSVSHHQIATEEGARMDPVFKSFAERRWARIQEGVAKAHAAGVKIATGTDPVIAGMEYRTEIELLVGCGLSPAAALLAATRDAAACLGDFGRDLGTLEVGRRADLLVLGGDPTADVRHVRDLHEVWQDGRPVVRHAGAGALDA